MAARTPEDHLTWYVINYYGGFMTKAEWLAHRTFMTEFKVQHAYSSELLEAADRQLRDTGGEPLRTIDPEALSLMRDGVEVFLRRLRDRILREHQDSVVLNHCPKCRGSKDGPRRAESELAWTRA